MTSNSNAVVFRLENITKKFGGPIALDEINLSVRQGQIMGLIGPNGAGKSTLFNVATSSIIQPSRGDIRLLLHPLDRAKVKGVPMKPWDQR